MIVLLAHIFHRSDEKIGTKHFSVDLLMGFELAVDYQYDLHQSSWNFHIVIIAAKFEGAVFCLSKFNI